jgi:hypothetical protein
VLDDAAWQRAASFGPYVDDAGRPAAPETATLVAYDRENLYIAAAATEPETGRLKMDVRERDGKVHGDDCFEITVIP